MGGFQAWPPNLDSNVNGTPPNENKSRESVPKQRVGDVVGSAVLLDFEVLGFF